MRQKRRRHFAFVLLRCLTWFYPRVWQPSVEQGSVLLLHVGTRLRRLLKSSYILWVLTDHPPEMASRSLG